MRRNWGGTSPQGHGFTTEFIRPLSVYLIRQKDAAPPKDPARLNSGHPDLANAPAYPVVLAGLMKVLPFRYDANLNGALWKARYQPDVLIALFNQGLFVVLIVLAFFWARWVFDERVAWTSVVLLIGTELLWRFSVSGLSTMMLLVIVMCLVWCLTLIEREAREPKWGPAMLAALSLVAGALAGLGGLTRYSFLWMIIPVALFLVLFGGPRRALLCVAALAAFAALMTPWLARNYAMSGHLFGVNSFAVIEGWLPNFRLQRSLSPDLGHPGVMAYVSKLVANLLPILQTDLLKLAGTWISAFFLVGLLVGYRNVALRRVRYFVVAGIVTLAVAQALGRTQLSDETPEINSENLLVLMAPVVLVFGVALFYSLLDGMRFAAEQWRYAAIGMFVAVLWFPMILAVASPKRSPMAYPPYRPDIIQSSGKMLLPDEMMMSDIPWAVAWYGQRQCIWLTVYANPSPDDSREWPESFFAVNDALKPVHALYLTPRFLDSRMQSEGLRSGEPTWANYKMSWGYFAMRAMVDKEVPTGFPLNRTLPGYLPEQLLLTDWTPR